MKHKNAHLLVGHWTRLRKGRAVPDQSDFDPRAIKPMLAHTFVIDASNPAQPLYRLAGTSLCQHFGGELKGTSFLDHWETNSATALTSLLRQGLRLKQPLCLLAIGAVLDAGMFEIETLLVPVAVRGGEPARYIGIMQVLGDTRSLYGRTIEFERLVGSQFIHEDAPVAKSRRMLPSGEITSLRQHPKAPHLRLVVSREAPERFEGEIIVAEVMEALARDDSKLVS
jgi:hypothetical protein